MADYSSLPILDRLPTRPEEEEENIVAPIAPTKPLRPVLSPPVVGTPAQTAEAPASVPSIPEDYSSIPIVDKIPDRKTITQQEILSNPEKMAAVRNYMIDRKGVQWKDRPDEEVLDTWMGHMRFFNTNEIWTVGELRYTLGADDNQKQRVKAAYDVYDELAPFYSSGDIGETIEGGWEYVKASAMSPSTYLGGFIGGKLAQKTLTEGAKRIIIKSALAEAKKGGGAVAANQLIKNATKSKVTSAVTLGILTDASVSSLQDYMYQLSRMEVGAQEEFDYVENAIALSGGLVGGGVAYIPQAAKGLTKLDAADVRIRTSKGIRSAGANKVIAEKLKTSVGKLTKDLKTWQQMKEDGAPILESSLEDVLNKVNWFFDINDENSIVRAVIDSGADIDLSDNVRFTEEIANVARNLSQENIDEYNEILKPTGVKFGQILDYIARAESSGGTILHKAQQAKKFAKDFANMSAASKQVDEDIVRDTIDLMDIPPDIANTPQGIKYLQSVWRRLLVSHPGTTALNVLGWGQAFGGRTLAETLHATTLGGAGIVGKMAGAKWGDKALSRSRALFQNQVYKLKMLLDPFSTIEGFLDMTNKLPNKMHRNTIKAYFGGVDAAGAAEIYKMNPKNPLIKGAEAVTDLAAKASLIQVQDVFTKSFSGIAELDKLSRLYYNRGLDDLMEKGDTHLLTDEMWGTAIQSMLKDTFSVDHTKSKGIFGGLAKVVEEISNAPLVGFLFPFGRFMNNNLAFLYEYSPVALLPLAFKIAKSGGKEAAKFTTQEKVMRASVGSIALATLWSDVEQTMQRGEQWYETEDSTGDRVTKQNIAPENVYRIVARMIGLHTKGEGIPSEMWKELGQILGPGQWTRQLEGKNPLSEMVSYLSTATPEDQGEVINLITTIAKPIAGIAAGFTRPLDFPNKLVGMGTQGDVMIDRRQALSAGDAMKQELTRYTSNLFAPWLADNEAEDGSPIIGTPKRAATRPEGDIRDPNPYSSLFSRKEQPPANSIDILLGMTNLPPFIMDQRSAVPAFDHFVNEEVAPILNARAAQALRDPVFKAKPQNEKVAYVKDMLRSVRKEVIQNLGDGYKGGPVDMVNYERKKWSHLPLAKREMAKQHYGITTRDTDLSLMQLEVLKEYIKNYDDFQEYLIEN